MLLLVRILLYLLCGILYTEWVGRHYKAKHGKMPRRLALLLIILSWPGMLTLTMYYALVYGFRDARAEIKQREGNDG
jgi:hypothetical protein